MDRWKPHGKEGAFADLAPHLNLSSVALDDAQADGEPKPCPLALALGREERIEDLRQHVGGDTAARICDLDDAGSLIFERSHRHDALSLDGLYRVQDQIHQYLLNHVAVGHKQRKLAS